MLRSTIRVAIGTAIAAALAIGSVAGQGGGRTGGDPIQGGRAGGQGPGRGMFVPPRDATDQTATGTAWMAGTVTTEGTGTPVRRARVTISAPELRGSRSGLTDDQGRFVFPALPAGRYTLTASKAGFVNIAYGAKRAGRQGTAVQLEEGQRVERLNIAIPRGGVLTGVVVDEHGEPAASVPVRALRAMLQTGERTWQVVGQDTTDDRGIYRIFQLQPGDYLVSAMPNNARIGDDVRVMIANQMATLVETQSTGGFSLFAAEGVSVQPDAVAELQQRLQAVEQQSASAYAPVYYPGTASPGQAQIVTLAPGEERPGVDFRLQLLPTTRVTGIVASATGALPPGVQVMLVPTGGGETVSGLGGSGARVDGQGRFTFNSVTPGDYVLQARAVVRQDGEAVAVGRGRAMQDPGAQILWASMDLAVSGQPLPDVVLTLRDGMTVSGVVQVEGGSAGAFDPTGVRVILGPRGTQALPMGGTRPATVDDSGRFTIRGVAPGRYTLTTGVGGGRGGGGGSFSAQYSAKSAMLDGRDLLDFPLEIGPNENVSNLTITFTDRTQELSGTIQDTSGRPTADFTIVVFPADKRYWMPQARRIAATRPGTDGRFTFRGLPAGDYHLTAVTDVEPGEWYDPAFLAQLGSASIAITLNEGEKKIQDIRLAGG